MLDWRVRERDIRPSPSFFLHRLLGAGEDAVRADFTALLAGRSFEAVLPNVWSQYLSDMRLLDALAQHSERRRAASEAEWQVVDCAAYTSRVLGSVTNRTEAHHERMQALLGALLANPLWSDRRAKWLFIQPHYDLRGTVGRKLAEALVQRNAQIGPVIVATVDRDGAHIGSQMPYFDLYRRAVMVPHVATPELARTARLCLPGSCPADASRRGYLFHGDLSRFDGGVRGAMRHIIDHLRHPASLQAKILSRGTATDTNPEPGAGGTGRFEPTARHVAFRETSAATSRAMGESALCFSPQGDMMTTRRLFDALASGCVPVLMKSIGNAPRLWLLGSNPFHHSIDWRSIGLFLAPRSVNLGERGAAGDVTGKQTGGKHYPKGCRAEEAAWLDAKHDNESLVRGLREQGRDAFRAHLDVEYHPRGVAEALLRELAYVLDDDCATRRYKDWYNARPRSSGMSKNGYLYLPAAARFLAAGAEADGAAPESATRCGVGEEMLMEEATHAKRGRRAGRDRR